MQHQPADREQRRCPERCCSRNQAFFHGMLCMLTRPSCTSVQYLTVRNARGREMLDLVRPRMEVVPAMSSGDRRQFVMQTVISDDQ